MHFSCSGSSRTLSLFRLRVAVLPGSPVFVRSINGFNDPARNRAESRRVEKCSQGTEEGSGGSGRLPVFFRFFQSAPEEGKGLCKKIIGGQGILPDLVLGGFLCS